MNTQTPNDYKIGLSVTEINTSLEAVCGREEIQSALGHMGFDYEIVMPIPRALSVAKSLLGKPYKYGASVSYDAPGAFDCSSFTAYVFVQAGISIPRITVDQYVYGREVDTETPLPGDLVFARNGDDTEQISYTRVSDGVEVTQQVAHMKTVEFMPGTEVPLGIDHCGIYVGDGEIIHASGKWHRGEVVLETLKESPAFSDIRGVRRVDDNEERFVITIPKERSELRSRTVLIQQIGKIIEAAK